MRADGLADRGATHRGDDRGCVGAGGGVDMRRYSYVRGNVSPSQWQASLEK